MKLHLRNLQELDLRTKGGAITVNTLFLIKCTVKVYVYYKGLNNAAVEPT